MPRYFFSTRDGDRDEDNTGTPLADDQTARNEAIRYAGSMIHEQPDILLGHGEYQVELRDADRELLMTVKIIAVEGDHARQ